MRTQVQCFTVCMAFIISAIRVRTSRVSTTKPSKRLATGSKSTSQREHSNGQCRRPTRSSHKILGNGSAISIRRSRLRTLMKLNMPAHHISISKSSVWRIIHDCGLTYKVLERRAMHIKEQDVFRFVEELSNIID
ncbi:hypothetical protein DVH05_028562 [Phytophthora capsici]|nr:hypothetical protein DVH05_028642 [Phytophthora capsici]KAG1702435.1 hypothetical protein DVH05_028562 [Phytophthora capsici]